VRPQPAPSAAKPAPIQPAEAIKPVAPGPSTTSASALAAATAAAAAAAIAEGRARDRKAIEQVKPAAAQPRLELPNVATTPGAGAVAVPGHMQATRPPLAPGDDLKRIQTVTPEIEAALNKLGVRRYGDIASWSAQEVSRVAQALGLRGRIEQENWIEQAQILSKGVATAYSSKYDRGELVTSAQPSKSAPAASLSPEARTAMTAAALTAARAMSTAKAPITVPSASIAAATAAAEKVASAIAPSVAPARPLAPGPSAADRAKQLASTLAAPIAPAPSAAKPSVTPLPQPPPETVVTGDDLKRIRGIDRDLERLLNRLGVTSFASIARWSPGEIDHYGAALGLASGRIQRESWVEQARVLAGATLFAEARAPGPAPEEARVVRQRMVSVKSEALQDRFETGMARGGRNVRSGIPDDLKRIKGIGVVLEKKLNAIGVIGYEQIAAWTDADVQRVSEQLDFKGRIERENWIEQARILASGGMTEFARRFDRGEVEAPPPRKA
jgi:predicted flap endonuclease-1-like 5' DNA nuclease